MSSAHPRPTIRSLPRLLIRVVPWCLVAACAAPVRRASDEDLAPAPPWALAQPALEAGRWVAAGSARAATFDEAEALAVADARSRLMALRNSSEGPADPLSRPTALPDPADSLSLLIPADGQRFARRLADDQVEVFVQVSAADIELFPRQSLLAAAALADPGERARGLLELARAFLLRGLDAHCQAALELLPGDAELPPGMLLDLAALQQQVGRHDEALATNARVLALLGEEPTDKVLADRARQQQQRLASGIPAIEDSLLELERLTRSTRRDKVLAAPVAVVSCADSQMAAVGLVVGSEAGRLAPLWVDSQGVRLVNLSDDGRVFGRSVELSVGLLPEIEEATLLVWLLPEDDGVLEIIDSLRGQPLPSVDALADDAQRLKLGSLIEGLSAAAQRPGVGAVVVRLER